MAFNKSDFSVREAFKKPLNLLHTKKLVRAVGSFPPQNWSKLANQTGQNHCVQSVGLPRLTQKPWAEWLKQVYIKVELHL